tara:strand:- start:27 stop:488 length:462 start_codon:yes stop_codon:yes gene_type:complete
MKFIRIGPKDGRLFDSIVNNDYAFVKFYSPGCFHCNEMAAEWDALENAIGKDIKKNVNIIEVHVNAISSIKSKCANNITGFPTIMEVKSGGIPGVEYNGPRTSHDFIQFINSTFPSHQKKIRRSKNTRIKRKLHTKPKRKRQTRRLKNKKSTF